MVVIVIGFLGTIASSIVVNGTQTKTETLDADGVYLNNSVFTLTEPSASAITWVGNGSTNITQYSLATRGLLTVSDNSTITGNLQANYTYSRVSGVGYVMIGLIVLLIVIGMIVYISKETGLKLSRK